MISNFLHEYYEFFVIAGWFGVTTGLLGVQYWAKRKQRSYQWAKKVLFPEWDELAALRQEELTNARIYANTAQECVSHNLFSDADEWIAKAHECIANYEEMSERVQVISDTIHVISYGKVQDEQ